jgi:transcriptional regulator with XRE-family HTH domain
MVSEIGKFLRILRVSRDESAKTMAERFGVSSAYLSAVELGKRPMPSSWKDIIIREYNLNEKNQQKLQEAIKESLVSITINLSDMDSKKKELLLSMAKKDLDDETIDKLCEIMNKKKDI